MKIKTGPLLSLAACAVLAGCDQASAPGQGQVLEALELQYVMTYKDAPGSKKCLAPKQLNGSRWFTLCGMNTGGPGLANAGLWELREEGGAWVALASNGRASDAQERFTDPKIKPPDRPPQVDVAQARALCPE